MPTVVWFDIATEKVARIKQTWMQKKTSFQRIFKTSIHFHALEAYAEQWISPAGHF